MIDNLSITVHAFARHMLTSLSVNEILLLRYVNLSTNFRGPPHKIEMVPSCSVALFNFLNFLLEKKRKKIILLYVMLFPPPQ